MLPDIENIIRLSEVFNVSTDFLLKNDYQEDSTSTKTNENKEKINYIAKSISIISTGLNLIGLIVAICIWVVWQTPFAFFTGFAVQILSLVLFEVFKNNLIDKKIIYKKFYQTNIWILLLIPVFVFINYIMTFYPRPYSVLIVNLVAFLFYLLLSFLLSLLFKKMK